MLEKIRSELLVGFKKYLKQTSGNIYSNKVREIFPKNEN